jgi:nucleoside-diphosphate-sugar epimerase
MRVLFLGGTGTISTACSALAVERGHDLTLVTRGSADDRAPEGARILHADARDPDDLRRALGDRTFDVVVDWIAFAPDHVEMDIDVFRGRTGQFVFISSASAYQTPPETLPVAEDTPLDNPFWDYSRAKIACEARLTEAHGPDLPVTIVRPSHTLAPWSVPFQGGYTVIDRMRRGASVVVHDRGESLWTLTHHRDFARGFVPLLGDERALGEAFHITSDEALTWNRILALLARAAGVPDPDVVHVPSARVAEVDARWGASFLGDKANSMVFDNAKLKALVPDFEATIPYEQTAAETVAWYDAAPSRRTVDPEADRLYDVLAAGR